MSTIAVNKHEEHSGRLVAEVACPNCWHKFPPEDLLFIARHASLIGDDIAGKMAYRRFLPTRFNIAGNAIDSRGMECQDLACPKCHLGISRPLIEMLPFFVSVVGAPASGKSYFLGAMTWEMRSRAPRLGVIFSDGDPTANAELQRYEELLFLNANPDTPVEIRKTEIQGSELYQTIELDGQSQTFPRPFVFKIDPAADSFHARGDFHHRAIVLYDNAGEHFLPGQDSTSNPVTLHLSQSESIMFVFDPTQDPRFRAKCTSEDPQLSHGMRPGSEATLIRQEVILNEAISRIRRYRGLSQTQQTKRPLVMILAKADIWLDMINEDLEEEPYRAGDPESLDVGRVAEMSQACRGLMKELCPEIVAAAEGFSKEVIYVPVSALGTSPELIVRETTRFYGIRPKNITPKWVTVPLAWTLAQGVPDVVSTCCD